VSLTLSAVIGAGGMRVDVAMTPMRTKMIPVMVMPVSGACDEWIGWLIGWVAVPGRLEGEDSKPGA
jgi:hypothetical protein